MVEYLESRSLRTTGARPEGDQHATRGVIRQAVARLTLDVRDLYPESACAGAPPTCRGRSRPPPDGRARADVAGTSGWRSQPRRPRPPRPTPGSRAVRPPRTRVRSPHAETPTGEPGSRRQVAAEGDADVMQAGAPASHRHRVEHVAEQRLVPPHRELNRDELRRDRVGLGRSPGTRAGSPAPAFVARNEQPCFTRRSRRERATLRCTSCARRAGRR